LSQGDKGSFVVAFPTSMLTLDETMFNNI